MNKYQEWRKQKGITIKAFCTAVDPELYEHTAQDWFAGKRKISRLYMEKVLLTFPDFPGRTLEEII